MKEKDTAKKAPKKEVTPKVELKENIAPPVEDHLARKAEAAEIEADVLRDLKEQLRAIQKQLNEQSEEKRANKKIEQAAPEKTPLDYQRDRDQEKVRGVFHYHELPGQTLSFFHRVYKKDPIELHEFKDGDTITITRGVARHLKESGWRGVKEHVTDPSSSKKYIVVRKEQRYTFESSDFALAEPGLDKNIVTATPV